MPRAISKCDRTPGGRLDVTGGPAPDVSADWGQGGGYSVAEVAHHLSVSTKTVRRLVKDGTLQHVKIGRRVVVTASSVAALLGRAQ